MTILFLTRLFYPHIGGVEKHVLKLSEQLINQGHRIHILTTQFDSSLELEDSYQGISITRIPLSQTKGKLKIFTWVQQHISLFRSANIIHAHDITWWAAFLRHQIHAPIFTTFHGWEGVFPITFKAKVWRRWSEHLSRGNICVGDFISRWYGTHPNIVTYGATDQPALDRGDPNRLLVFGRLATDTDIDLVLEALKLLKKDLPQLKISFLGDGDAAWKAQSLGPVMGFHTDTNKYLSQAGWVIASSYLSMLETMASGRYLFSFYSNPLKKDYLKLHPQAKHFSQHYTPESFVTQFHTLAQHPHQTDLHIQTVQAWASSQTWEHLASQYLQLWQPFLPIGDIS